MHRSFHTRKRHITYVTRACGKCNASYTEAVKQRIHFVWNNAAYSHKETSKLPQVS